MNLINCVHILSLHDPQVKDDFMEIGKRVIGVIKFANRLHCLQFLTFSI